jgi:hypothetical protein
MLCTTYVSERQAGGILGPGHHTRKGTLTPGDADTGRGGSSIKDAGRLVCTLTVMREEEAKM